MMMTRSAGSSLRSLLFLVFCHRAFGALVNVTIDDTFGDPITGAQFSYTPTGAWNNGPGCTVCDAHPDPTQAWEATWHDGTFDALPGFVPFPNTTLEASVSFNGTAIYVICILALTSSSPDGTTDILFFIDDGLVGSFLHVAPGTDGYAYNVTVYSNTTIPPGQHILRVQSGQVNGLLSMVLLDSVIYSFDDGVETSPESSSSPSSIPFTPSSTPAMAPSTSPSTQAHTVHSKSSTTLIIAITISIISMLSFVGAGYLFYRRHRRQLIVQNRRAVDQNLQPQSGWFSTRSSTSTTHLYAVAPSNASVPSTNAIPPESSKQPPNLPGPSTLTATTSHRRNISVMFDTSSDIYDPYAHDGHLNTLQDGGNPTRPLPSVPRSTVTESSKGLFDTEGPPAYYVNEGSYR